MIEKLKGYITDITMINKIDELVDVVNGLVEENNIHEKQIDELQMKVEPEKCETPADPYAKQRQWIGKLCRFRDKYQDEVWEYGTLEDVENVDSAIDSAFRSSDGSWYDICEPVKPDDDIIYKGE